MRDLEPITDVSMRLLVEVIARSYPTEDKTLIIEHLFDSIEDRVVLAELPPRLASRAIEKLKLTLPNQPDERSQAQDDRAGTQ